MSKEDIERLVAERSLAREAFADDVIASLWAKAAAAFADSAVPGISTDSAFQLVYTAGLQATLSTLAAHGLRVKSTAHHYKAFYALQKLDDALQPHGRMFDEMRVIRHGSVYEPTHDDAELAERLAEVRTHTPGDLAALRTATMAVRPGIEARLPRIR